MRRVSNREPWKFIVRSSDIRLRSARMRNFNKCVRALRGARVVDMALTLVAVYFFRHLSTANESVSIIRQHAHIHASGNPIQMPFAAATTPTFAGAVLT